MAKRCRDPESDVTTSASGFKTVFVATSLDTHLAMTLSFSDTVADFKEKIMLQHEQCFPETGSLTVHSLKVEYQGKMYHLHESDMVVSSAFEGYEGRWPLFVDASSSLEVVKEQNALVPCDKGKLESSWLPLATDAIAWKSAGESSQYSLEVGHVDGNLKSVENDLRSKDNSKDQNEKLPSRNSYEARSGGGLNAKKKQKIKHSLHVAGESALNATRTSPQTTMSGRSNNEAGGLEDSIVRAGQKVSTVVQLGGRDAGASPHNTTFSGTKTSERTEPESHVFEKDAVYGRHSEDPSIRSQVSDMENKSLKKSVAELRENMTSPDVSSQQVQEVQPAISAAKKKRKRKKQHQETNSFVPYEHAATSKPGTVLQGSVLTEEACEGQTLGSGNHGMVNDESLLTSTGNLRNNDNEEYGRLSSNHEVGLSENDKPSDLVETTPAKKEIVICLGMLDKSPEADNSEVSKSKIRTSRKSAVRKEDQLDVEHDLSSPSKVFVAIEGAAPRAHIDDQSRRDENILPQNDPKKSEENSKLAKNNVPVAICSGGSYKHLDSDETNLNEKESASDIAFNVRDDPEGGKSGCRPKKKKTKRPASKDDYRIMERTKDANDPLALKISLSEYIPGAVMADKSIFSCIEGMEEPKKVSPTNSHKNANGDTASDNDNVHLPLSEVEHNQSRNEDLDLKSGKESDILQSQDRATVQGQVNTEHAKEAECPMDHPDGEPKNKGTTKKKRKKKAKRTGNSTGEGLSIPEVNPENIGDEKLASLVEKSTDLDYADTLKVNGSDEKRSIDHSGVSELGLGKNSDVKGTGKSEQLLQNSDGPEVPAHEIESNCEVRHDTVVSMANNDLASEGENGSVNFRRYFIPGDDHGGAASTEKVEGESNVVGAEKANEQTIVPEGKQRPSKSLGNQKNSSGINTDDNSHEHSSSKAKQNKSASEMETSTSSRKRSKSLRTTRDANVKALKKSVDLATVTVPCQLEENNGSLTSSNLNSVSRDSNKILLNKSNQKKQTAEGGISRKKVKDLDKSSQEKGLLTTPGIIFGDGLSESSGDENGNLKSGSSTQSPSDSSSSSSSSSEDLMREGYINKDHKGGKTALGSKLADPRNMSMDTILKSSSWFKKAKLTASQTEADSQQVDFVPESQPFH